MNSVEFPLSFRCCRYLQIPWRSSSEQPEESMPESQVDNLRDMAREAIKNKSSIPSPLPPQLQMLHQTSHPITPPNRAKSSRRLALPSNTRTKSRDLHLMRVISAQPTCPSHHPPSSATADPSPAIDLRVSSALNRMSSWRRYVASRHGAPA